MKSTILFFLMAASFTTAKLGAQPAVDLSLEGLVSQVLSNNPSLKAARSNWQAMRERIPQARAWEDARFDLRDTAGRFVDVSPNSFSDQMFGVEQSIPLGGRNRLRGNAAEAEALSAWAELRRTELDLIARTRVAYFRLANAYAQLDLNRKDAGLWKEVAETSRSKYGAGNRSEADVLSAETELARLEEGEADYKRQISDSQIELNGLMDRPGFTPLPRPAALALTPLSFSRAMVEGLTLRHRPELLMAEEKVVAAQARLKAARREWIPDPSLRVQAERYNGAAQAISEVDLGFSVNLPWFNRAKYRAGIRENEALLESAQHELEAARVTALTAVENQLVKIETFHHHTELSTGELLPLAQQTITARRLGYQTDKGGFLELLTAQRNQEEIESMYWEHFTDYQIALAELEAIVGVNPISAATAAEHRH
jgi:outer membrane protein TolC